LTPLLRHHHALSAPAAPHPPTAPLSLHDALPTYILDRSRHRSGEAKSPRLGRSCHPARPGRHDAELEAALSRVAVVEAHRDPHEDRKSARLNCSDGTSWCAVCRLAAKRQDGDGGG